MSGAAPGVHTHGGAAHKVNSTSYAFHRPCERCIAATQKLWQLELTSVRVSDHPESQLVIGPLQGVHICL